MLPHRGARRQQRPASASASTASSSSHRYRSHRSRCAASTASSGASSASGASSTRREELAGRLREEMNMLGTLVNVVRGRAPTKQPTRQHRQHAEGKKGARERARPAGVDREADMRDLRRRVQGRSLSRYVCKNFNGSGGGDDGGGGDDVDGCSNGSNDDVSTLRQDEKVRKATHLLRRVHRVAQAAALMGRRKPGQHARKEGGAAMGAALEEALLGGTLGAILDEASGIRRQQEQQEQQEQQQGQQQQTFTGLQLPESKSAQRQWLLHRAKQSPKPKAQQMTVIQRLNRAGAMRAKAAQVSVSLGSTKD